MFDASINKYTREGYDLIFETRIKKWEIYIIIPDVKMI
jgi:hypothetical protein